MILSLRPLGKKQARINETLEDYWRTLKGDKPMPYEKDIKPESIAGIWDSCFLISIVPEENPRLKYSYLGQNLIEAYGDDLANKEVCEVLVYPTNDHLREKFEEVERTGAPTNEAGEFVNKNGAKVKYRSVLLPLAHDDGTVGFILGGMKWKMF